MTWYMATMVPNRAPTMVHRWLSTAILSSNQTPNQVNNPMAAAMEKAMPENRMKERGLLLFRWSESAGLRICADLLRADRLWHGRSLRRR